MNSGFLFSTPGPWLMRFFRSGKNPHERNPQHKWKRHHWNPKEPRTRCIRFGNMNKNGFKIASVEEWKAPRRHTALINYDDPAAVFTERVTLKMSTLALQGLLQILILVKLAKSQRIFSIWSQLQLLLHTYIKKLDKKFNSISLKMMAIPVYCYRVLCPRIQN